MMFNLNLHLLKMNGSSCSYQNYQKMAKQVALYVYILSLLTVYSWYKTQG